MECCTVIQNSLKKNCRIFGYYGFLFHCHGRYLSSDGNSIHSKISIPLKWKCPETPNDVSTSKWYHCLGSRCYCHTGRSHTQRLGVKFDMIKFGSNTHIYILLIKSHINYNDTKSMKTCNNLAVTKESNHSQQLYVCMQFYTGITICPLTDNERSHRNMVRCVTCLHTQLHTFEESLTFWLTQRFTFFWKNSHQCKKRELKNARNRNTYIF